jgi:hypothetical protein
MRQPEVVPEVVAVPVSEEVSSERGDIKYSMGGTDKLV